MRVVIPSDASSAALVAAGTATLLLLKLSHDWFAQWQRTRCLAGRDRDGNAIPLRKIPLTPSALPWLGNLIDYIVNAHRSVDWQADMCAWADYQPWKSKVPGQPAMIVLSSPDAIEEVTTTQFENFAKGEFFVDVMGDMFGRGLLVSDGERWHHQRKTAVKFFSARALRAFMTKSMHKNIGQVCDVLERSMESGELVDLNALFHAFTLQTFVEMGLGIDLKWIGAKQPHPFEHALDMASPQMLRRVYQPGWLWKLQRWLNIGNERVFAESMKIVYSWLREVTHTSLEQCLKRTTHSSSEDEVKSVVEIFVENSRDDLDGIRSEDLVDFLLTFIIGARDTTAGVLSWFFYDIHQHPEVLRRIRDEMAIQLPADLYKDKTAYLTTDHIRGLVYLEATIKEILRLKPAAPGTLRQVVCDTVICGDVPLYKGQLVALNAYGMARNPHVWGPDAAEFKPERWIDPTTRTIIRESPSKFFTFLAGPRSCIGMNLAMLELRVMAANLIHRFRFEIDPSNDGSYQPSLTLAMKHPLLVKVSAGLASQHS